MFKSVYVLTRTVGTLGNVTSCSCVISFLHSKVSPVIYPALPRPYLDWLGEDAVGEAICCEDPQALSVALSL